MEAVNALSYTFNSVPHEMVCASDAISGLPGVLDAPVRREQWCCADPRS